MTTTERIARVFCICAIGANLALLAACTTPRSPHVRLAEGPADVVTQWSEIAADTINLPASATGTAAERQPLIFADLALVHIAMHDAAKAAIAAHEPSQEAAVVAAAHEVLRALYPSRYALYREPYEGFVLSRSKDTAQQRGVALGEAAAQRLLQSRGDDGRSVVLEAFVSGTRPGEYRSQSPIGRNRVSMRESLASTLGARYEDASDG